MTIQFVVPVDCRPSPRVKGGSIRYYMPDWYKELKQTIGWYAQKAMRGRPPARSAVAVEILCFRNKNPLDRSFGDIPKTRPDSPVPSLQGPCDRSLKSEVPCGSCLNWR